MEECGLPIKHRKPIATALAFLASLKRDGKRYTGEVPGACRQRCGGRSPKIKKLAHGPCAISAEAPDRDSPQTLRRRGRLIRLTLSEIEKTSEPQLLRRNQPLGQQCWRESR
jgi:hypothetical protein